MVGELMQLRVGYYLTDKSEDDMGNMVMIPGSHNAAMKLPREIKGVEINARIDLNPNPQLPSPNP